MAEEEDSEEISVQLSFAENAETSFAVPIAVNQSQVESREVEELLGVHVLGDLSFSKPLEESFGGLEQMEKLEFDHFATYSVPKVFESPTNISMNPARKLQKRRVLVENQSSSRTRPTFKYPPKLTTPKNPKNPPKVLSKDEQITKKKFHWQLEDAFRKFLKSKLTTTSAEKILRNRVEVISEFQAEVEASTSRNISESQEAMYADTVLELYESLAEERNFRSELQYAGLSLQPGSKASSGKGMNWTRQQVVKEKAKLAREMTKFSRVK